MNLSSEESLGRRGWKADEKTEKADVAVAVIRQTDVLQWGVDDQWVKLL